MKKSALVIVVIVFLNFIGTGLFAASNINHEHDILQDFSKIDAKVKTLGKPKSVEELAALIAQVATNDWEKTRAIYVWLARNIDYDTESFFRDSIPDQNPEDVFASGKAVCEGYASLAEWLADDLDLEMVKVSGYSKGYSYTRGQAFRETNHAWNAFSIDGKWYLMDATWGSGYVGDDHKFVRDVTTTWFAMDPRLFFFTHYPENPQWALLDGDIPSLDEYTSSVYVPSYIFEKLWRNDFSYAQQIEIIEFLTSSSKSKNELYRLFDLKNLGFSNLDIITLFKSGNYPTVYSHPFKVSVLSLPKTGTLKLGQSYEFSVKIPDAGSVAIICGKIWHYVQRRNGVYTIKLKIDGGPVQVAAKQQKSNTYHTIIKYEVAK